MRPDEVKPETWAIAGGRSERAGAPLSVPIVPTAPFLHGTERQYARTDETETWEAFEDVMGGWEAGQAVAFASGMGACSAVLAQLPDGGRIVLGDDCYLGVAAVAEQGAREHGWQVERLPVADERWLTIEADLLWLESPSNPLLDVADVAAICARTDTTVVVDNTFCTPLLQRPLELGAHVSIYSATKYLGGHSDLLLGVAVTRDEAQFERLRTARSLTGATPGALECFLALRGLRTLPLRLRQASANAAELARRLTDHPAVTRVRYPGFGAVVSFDLPDADTAERACRATRLIRHATSLGGVETTMERRGMHHGQEHIPPGLIRMSVGCEDADDLWADLERAL